MGWYLDQIEYKFTQEGNTVGTTADEETISITVESSINSIHEDGGFLTIRTKTGWSINSPKEFIDMLDIVMLGIPAEKI